MFLFKMCNKKLNANVNTCCEFIFNLKEKYMEKCIMCRLYVYAEKSFQCLYSCLSKIYIIISEPPSSKRPHLCYVYYGRGKSFLKQ